MRKIREKTLIQRVRRYVKKQPNIDLKKHHSLHIDHLMKGDLYCYIINLSNNAILRKFDAEEFVKFCRDEYLLRDDEEVLWGSK